MARDKPPRKARADELLVTAQVASTLSEAQALIMAKKVVAQDSFGRERRIEKAGELCEESSTFRVTGRSAADFASRGGTKLDAAMTAFRIEAADRICADIGIGSGGFTDCLLRRGAQRVHGVDVGYGQVAWRIRNDPRVVLYERTNLRKLEPTTFGEPVSLVVVDVSFISLLKALPVLASLVSVPGDLIALVKPQFECERDDLVRGIVVDEQVRARALERVVACARSLDLSDRATIESPIRGADGNVEYLLHLTPSTRPVEPP